MNTGIVDIDEITGTEWLRKEVLPGESLLRFTNPFVILNKDAENTTSVKPALKILSRAKVGKLSEDISGERQGVLDLISPPRIWQVKDQTWMQKVSPQPSQRCEMQLLREKIDKCLEEKSARDFGICPKRIAIFGEAFDELIRQVTITCAERGIMLLKVREELKMTFSSYKVMFEDSLKYIDKLITPAETIVSSLVNEKKVLKNEINELRYEYESLASAFDLFQRRTAEERHTKNSTYHVNKRALVKTKRQLVQLVSLLNQPEIIKPQRRRGPVQLDVPITEEQLKDELKMEKLQKIKDLRESKLKSIRTERKNRMNEILKKEFLKELHEMAFQQKATE